MKLKRTVARSAVILALLGASGCFTVPRFEPLGALEERSAGVAACGNLRAALVGEPPFRALLNTTLDAPDGESYSFRYAVVGNDSGDLRVDLLPNEGAFTLGLITIRGDQALLIDSQRRVFSRGCGSEALFERFFGLEGINAGLIRALVTGVVPALNCQSVKVYRSSAGDLTLLDPVRHHAWRVSERSGELLGVNLLDDKDSRIRVSAERVSLDGQRGIKITVYKPAHAEALMSVSRFNPKPNLTPELFEVSVPGDYQRESCEG
ncbi:MAG: hypothetical protein ACK5Y6_03700 [Pseudomonadota bacterium]|jgi:hypothetical protein